MSDSEMSPASKTSDVHRLVSSQNRAFIEPLHSGAMITRESAYS